MSAEMPVSDTTPPDQTAPIRPAPAPAATAGVSRAAVLVVVIALLVGALAGGSITHTATTATWPSPLADGTTDESTDRNDYTLVLQNGTWLVDNDVQPDSASSGTGATTPPGSRPIPQGQGIGARDTSSNWSGYAATGGTFTAVSGTGIVPQPSGTTSGVDATWGGVGGLPSTDLIQAGTQTMVSGRGGAQYEAWIELLPRSSQPVPLSVSPGDTVTVSITQQGDGRWLIAMRNDTTGRTYSTTVTYASSTSSAEWIQEAPSAGRRVISLDDFGTLQFTKGSAVKDGKSASIRDAGGATITVIDRTGRALARPSALGPDGASFTVTRA